MGNNMDSRFVLTELQRWNFQNNRFSSLVILLNLENVIFLLIKVGLQ